jgi:hypothetical protein
VGTALLAAFAQQVQWCERAGAPFTARVLARSQRWLEGDAAAHQHLSALSADPLAGAVALRWAAALHGLALRGLAPWCELWPPATAGVGAALDEALDAAIDAAIQRAWHDQRPLLDTTLASPPQTNEVQRSAALLPGLLRVAERTALPLALLEIGASAGLNLWCERWRLDAGAWAWGDPAAPLTLRPEWPGGPPPLGAPLRVLQRAGCDVAPLDITQPEHALRLASYVWAEQRERAGRLHRAQAAAAGWMRAEGLRVRAQPAADFVAAQLARRPRHAVTVLMHSVMWQYLGSDEQLRIGRAMQEAGAQASAAAPLAWLRMEPPQPDLRMELRLRLWPGGDDELLAHAHPHGQKVEWLAS